MVASMITRPSKTFEFWACGKPVIACSKDEMAALIEQSEADIALPPGDPDILAEAIKQLYSNRGLAADMGKKGREFVLHRFSYDALDRNLTKMFDQLIP